MNKEKLWLERVPIHPLLFSAYPVLALLAFNVSEVNASSGFRALSVSILAAIFLTGMLRWIFRDWQKAALISTGLLILFYSYGQVYVLLKGIEFGGTHLFRHRTLAPIWLAGGVTLLWLAGGRRVGFSAATQLLNVAGVFLLFLPVYELISHFMQSKISQAEVQENTHALALQTGSSPPDIYYIIMDGYGRADVLNERYGFDNSEFLNSLRDLGFFVADCSQSNYAQTQLSLSSALNFNYIAALSDRFVSGSDDRAGLDELIRHSAARESLEAVGYKTVSFATGFVVTEWADADYFLGPQQTFGDLNEFEYLLLETTLVRLIQDGSRLNAQTSGSELFRERTLFTLEKLAQISTIAGPKLVFVHLLIPHPPYVFGPTGGPVEASEVGNTTSGMDVIHYRDQAIYASSRMMEIVPAIIENSATPPIIVIQGDHGPTVPSSPQMRMRILNAYYLPGVEAPLYSAITPVNTFRIIFNAYFDQQLDLLEDVSLYSGYDDPFTFKQIPNLCSQGG